MNFLPTRQRPQVWIWPATGAVFLVLATLTVLVWRQQIDYRHRMQSDHLNDACAQIARGLELFLESRLGAANLFALRWVGHERRDYSQSRFLEFAPLLIEAMPGYHAVHLVDADRSTIWTAPPAIPPAAAWSPAGLQSLLAEAEREGQTVLSGPLSIAAGPLCVAAVQPLRRGGEDLGALVTEIDIAAMLEICFPAAQRHEFLYALRDAGATLARAPGAFPAAALETATLRAERPVSARNRSWSLILAFRPGTPAAVASQPPVAVPLLGLTLALAFSALTYLLLHRMALVRAARDQALSEVAAREAAQLALRLSESRYRSVFNAATDSLIVLDEDDALLETNAATSALFGCAPVDLSGLTLRELFSPEQSQAYEEFRRQLETVGSVRFDSAVQRRDGGRLEVEVRGTRLSYGSAPRTLVILTDVSARLRAQQQYAQLSRKVLLAQEAERLRLSRDLHDELGQLLTAIRLELGWLQKLPPHAAGDAATVYRNSVELVEKAAEELRRICKGLRPPLLDDLGLVPAVRQLVEEFRERTGLEANLAVPRNEQRAGVPTEVALCTYRILQESLTNISRHAEAQAIDIALTRSPTELGLSVYDDGQGFDLSQLEQTSGSGLAGMRERALLVGGNLVIRSARHQGTRIVLRIPLPESPAKVPERGAR